MKYKSLFYLKSNEETLDLLHDFVDCSCINTPDEDNATLLGTAIEYRRIDEIEYLLGCGADVNQKSCNEYPLEIATCYSNLAIVKILFENGAQIQKDNHCLISAIRARSEYDLTAHLIKMGADPNDMYEDCNETALWWAGQAMNGDVMELLLKHGADPNVIINGISTCLTQAIGDGFLSGVKLLLKYGADPNLCYPLQMAVVWCYPAIDILLNAGADINLPNHEGRTVLFTERVRNHFSSCDYLIKRGADPTIRDKDGIDFHMLNDNNLRKKINDEWGYYVD